MTTPRKNWSRQPDEILGMGWSDSVVADFVRLQAFLNIRWARYGLTPEEAGEAVLTAQEMMLVTNVQSPARARRRLLGLPANTPQGTFSARPENAAGAPRVRISWSKFAEFQGYLDRRHPNSGQSSGNLDPGNALSEKRREEKKQEEEQREESHSPSSFDRFRSQKNELTEPPEDLSEEQKRRLTHWVKHRHPYYRPIEKRRELVDACLRYHRAKGSRLADWEMECQRWIDRQAEYDGETPHHVGRSGPGHPQEPGASNGQTESLASVLSKLGAESS